MLKRKEKQAQRIEMAIAASGEKVAYKAKNPLFSSLNARCYGGLVEKKKSPQAADRAGDERLAEFIAAWEEEFGEELSEGEARIRLGELVEFYCLVARPVPDKRPLLHGGLGDVGI